MPIVLSVASRGSRKVRTVARYAKTITEAIQRASVIAKREPKATTICINEGTRSFYEVREQGVVKGGAVGFCSISAWDKPVPRAREYFVDDDAVYHTDYPADDGHELLGKFDADGEFVPSRFLMELPTAVHDATEAWVKAYKGSLYRERE